MTLERPYSKPLEQLSSVGLRPTSQRMILAKLLFDGTRRHVTAEMLRYEVLKRAKFHCELCGISAKEKALEVDHILPRSKGGEDDISNLQALCYSCNAMKGNKDDTDFREVRESYDVREAGCPFCKMAKKRVVAEQPLAYAVRDGYPVSELHTLIIPRRHVADYFDRVKGNDWEEKTRGILGEDKWVV